MSCTVLCLNRVYSLMMTRCLDGSSLWSDMFMRVRSYFEGDESLGWVMLNWELGVGNNTNAVGSTHNVCDMIEETYCF